jgi:hypothetical protein
VLFVNQGSTLMLLNTIFTLIQNMSSTGHWYSGQLVGTTHLYAVKQLGLCYLDHRNPQVVASKVASTTQSCGDAALL